MKLLGARASALGLRVRLDSSQRETTRQIWDSIPLPVCVCGCACAPAWQIEFYLCWVSQGSFSATKSNFAVATAATALSLSPHSLLLYIKSQLLFQKRGREKSYFLRQHTLDANLRSKFLHVAQSTNFEWSLQRGLKYGIFLMLVLAK